jgi:hypothetical protein
MKYIFLLFMIIPFNANSCIIMPEQNEVSKKYGFSYEVNPSDFDSYSNEINIIAPLVYKGEKFDLGVFSVFLDGRLVSKSVHSTINEDGVPEFFGYVSSDKDFTYRVSFLYGEGRCKKYEFFARESTLQP